VPDVTSEHLTPREEPRTRHLPTCSSPVSPMTKAPETGPFSCLWGTICGANCEARTRCAMARKEPEATSCGLDGTEVVLSRRSHGFTGSAPPSTLCG
jgi:hypothetical protein